MSDLQKITDQQMDAVGVCSAPDVLSGSTSENKAVFDKMVRQLIAPAYNAAVDAIDAINETETGIQAAEEARVSAEEGRVSAEAERETAEEARVSAEEARVQAEQERAAAEEKREDTETGYVAQAEDAAQLSENWAQSSESWAVGGTGTRPGEDTNNAKYWSDEARKAAGGGVASFNGRTGVVLPEEGDYTREMLGIRTIHFGPQTSGNAFAITAEQMDQLLSDFPPLVFVTVEGLEIMLMRYDKTSDTAYYSNSLYDQDRKRFVRLVAKGTSATVHSAEESQIPMPSGGGDNGKYLRANAGGGFDLVSPDFFTKAETLKAATAALYGLDSGAVPDDVFNRISKLLGGFIIKVYVQIAGVAAGAGISVTGMKGLDGEALVTDSEGAVLGLIHEKTVTITVSKSNISEEDMKQSANTFTIDCNYEAYSEKTVNLVSQPQGFVLVTTSKTVRFSAAVKTVDLFLVGGGGGGQASASLYYHGYNADAEGGNGGEKVTQLAVPLTDGSVVCSIGSGGSSVSASAYSSKTTNTKDGGTGGTTTVKIGATTYTAAGGEGRYTTGSNNDGSYPFGSSSFGNKYGASGGRATQEYDYSSFKGQGGESGGGNGGVPNGSAASDYGSGGGGGASGDNSNAVTAISGAGYKGCVVIRWGY